MRALYDKYVAELKAKKDKQGNIVNQWAVAKNQMFWEDCWLKIEQSGLEFDGKHITVNTNGVSYDYVAYKNKMLLVYPESQIDVELVYNGDIFSFEKTNGIVDYKHIYKNPFSHKGNEIIGGYCVIKNKRGQFLTLLSKSEIEKAKAVAKSKSIWDAWYSEMCKKTVIKKAVKFHFDDIYSQMEEEDNKNYDIELKPLPESLEQKISKCTTAEEVREIYQETFSSLDNATQRTDFISLCKQKVEELANANS